MTQGSLLWGTVFSARLGAHFYKPFYTSLSFYMYGINGSWPWMLPRFGSARTDGKMPSDRKVVLSVDDPTGSHDRQLTVAASSASVHDDNIRKVSRSNSQGNLLGSQVTFPGSGCIVSESRVFQSSLLFTLWEMVKKNRGLDPALMA